MSLLTTAHATVGRLLTAFGDTSAATAQAARIAALIHAEYPDLWPETVRGLLIHSAEWTPAMQRAFDDPEQQLPAKEKCRCRLRRYGYGVPSLRRALYSARNSLTLIAQDSLQPFDLLNGDVKTKDMRIHSLPWPINELRELGGTTITMRITLSYFIEPKPGRRGFAQTRHRYESHGLRFEVKRPVESIDDLRKRVSKAAREEGEKYDSVGDTAGWVLGPKLRTRGSVHSDWWQGTAADLVESGSIAVFPVSGWWRESANQELWRKHARYTLIVTIDSPETTVDLYTPVQTMIATETQIEP